MQAIIERIMDGRPTAVIGQLPNEVARDTRIDLLEVHCDALAGPLTPFIEGEQLARALVAARKGPGATLPLACAPRHRLAGTDAEPRDLVRSFVATLNELRAPREPAIALVFGALESADAGTLSALRRIVLRSGWLRVALLFQFGAAPQDGPARELLEALELVEGPSAIVRSSASTARPVGPIPDDLPDLTRRVLQAACVVGEFFDPALVARLLDLQPMRVMEQLQAASDRGVPIDDNGTALHIPKPVADALRAEVLPSLARAWHARLAALLSEPARQGTATVPRAPASAPAASASRAYRAAEHAQQAGDFENSARQYITAARQVAEHGAHLHAEALLGEVLGMLNEAPDTPVRQELHLSAIVELARLKWQTTSAGRTASLDELVRVLKSARQSLSQSEPPPLRAELSALLAGILYDVGSRDALEEAIQELALARRIWSELEQPLKAAALLVDEAAVWVRAGDVKLAHRLLAEAERVFGAAADADAGARFELAQTHHLRARATLHEPLQGQAAREAVNAALVHAFDAERLYRALERPLHLARAWETTARLERLVGRDTEAAERLTAAVDLQQRLGDLLGLARSSGALALLCLDGGEFSQAAGWLERSIDLNREKGSRAGLAYNRLVLEELARRLARGSTEAGELEALLARVAAAEQELSELDASAEPAPARALRETPDERAPARNARSSGARAPVSPGHH